MTLSVGGGLPVRARSSSTRLRPKLGCSGRLQAVPRRQEPTELLDGIDERASSENELGPRADESIAESLPRSGGAPSSPHDPPFVGLAVFFTLVAGSALILWRHMSKLLHDEDLVGIDDKDEYIRAVEAKYQASGASDGDEKDKQDASLKGLLLDDVNAGLQYPGAGIPAARPQSPQPQRGAGQIAPARQHRKGPVLGPPPPQAKGSAMLGLSSEDGSSVSGHVSPHGRGGDTGTASHSPRVLDQTCWWMLHSFYVLVQSELAAGASGEAPPFLLLQLAGGTTFLPAFQAEDEGREFAAAVRSWAIQDPSLCEDTSLQWSTVEFETEQLDVRNVPLIFVVAAESISKAREMDHYGWRIAVNEDVLAQREAWLDYLRRVTPVGYAPVEPEAPPVQPGLEPHNFSSVNEMEVTAHEADPVRMLTARETDSSLVKPDYVQLPVVYAPMLFRPMSGGDQSMLTLNASLGEDVEDIVAVVFEDAVDASALLAMLAHAPGYTDHDGVSRRVVPLPVEAAEGAAELEGATLLCLKAGFSAAANVRAGADMASVISTMVGARWASMVESQIQAAAPC